jgi:myo-inositol-1(or 4)-monophosphatase
MHPSLIFMAELAERTGKHLLQYFNPLGTTPKMKEDHSLVTEADLAADRLITEALLSRYPDSVVLSEELSPKLVQEGQKVWIVDPLDGTTNFSLGLPVWGISIALMEEGSLNSAVVYFPVFREIFTAQIGRGAKFNGNEINLQTKVPVLPNTVFSCCSRTFRRYEVNIKYKSRIMGSASYSLCALARGIAIISFEATPKIWDIAASWLIVREAGGVIETFDGSQPFPLSYNCDYQRQNYPTLAATTTEILNYARESIKLKA